MGFFDAALFDGKTFGGWTTASGRPVGEGWEVTPAGEIHCLGQNKGDLVTARDYLSFELNFEWKLAPNANGGVKYRWGKYGGQQIGIEYQLLDDPQGRDGGKHATASVYDLIAPDPRLRAKPALEWNRSRILARGPRIEHWLNGKRAASVELGKPAWDAALAASKFKNAKDFGTLPGKVLLQDHGGECWFRNLRLRELG